MLQPAELLLNRYEISALIGRGGMGSIYRAWDRNLHVACAVKLNETTAPGAAGQFMREAQMLATLHHPNLPRVYDYFDLPGRGQCLVMNFIEGSDLQAQIDRRGALPPAEALGYVRQVCDALAYMHERQPPIVHRDIKPANIRITPDGTAVLVDFGIARAVATGSVTTQGARAVSPGYSPPEQYGSGQTTPRSDVYALGATLWALLSGAAPPASTDRLAGNPLPPPTTAAGPLGAVLQRALALNPADRYADGAALRVALAEMNATPTPPAAPGWRLPAIGAAVVLVGLLAVFGAGRLFGGAGEPTPTPATIIVYATSAADVPGTAEAASLPSATPTAAPTATPTASPTPTAEITPTPTATATPTPSPTPAAQTAADTFARLYGGGGEWVLPSTRGQDYVPVLAPDNRTLVYGSDTSGSWQLYALDVATGSTRQLTARGIDHYHPRFNADGSRIVYASEQTGDWEIWTMRPDGSDQRQVTSVEGADWRPAYLPDGRIIYMGQRGGTWGIYVTDGDGRNQRLLRDTGRSAPYPVASADGGLIAFMEIADGNYEIFVMNSDGSGARRLTDNDRRDAEPAFSPDGRWIVYESQLSGGYEIMGVSVAGGTPRQLTSGGGNQLPSVSPDGTLLLYQSSRNGDYDLYARRFAP